MPDQMDCLCSEKTGDEDKACLEILCFLFFGPDSTAAQVLAPGPSVKS